MVLLFEEGELFGLEEDDGVGKSVVEVVVVAVSFLPSSPFFLPLPDIIDTV